LIDWAGKFENQLVDAAAMDKNFGSLLSGEVIPNIISLQAPSDRVIRAGNVCWLTS